MTQAMPVKYSAEEWEYFRKRFFNSMLNDTQVAALGQNVGVSWPFKGSDETPAKYIEFELPYRFNEQGNITRVRDQNRMSANSRKHSETK